MSNVNEMVLDLDSISDSDFDFLCDTALNLTMDTLNLTEADEITLNKITDRLNSEKYDINIEVDMPHDNWWQEEELPDLLNDSNSQEESNKATIELNIISITSSGSHAGERVVVASVHADVPANLQNIEACGLENLKIKWLPELDN